MVLDKATQGESMEHKYQVGDKVVYRGSWGYGPEKEAIIETADDEKNGRPVYDLNDGHWCYEDQIKKVK